LFPKPTMARSDSESDDGNTPMPPRSDSHLSGASTPGGVVTIDSLDGRVLPAAFVKRKPPFADPPAHVHDDGDRSGRSARANPQGSSGSVSSSSEDGFDLAAAANGLPSAFKPPLAANGLASDATTPATTSSSASAGSLTPRLGSKHHYGVLQDAHADAEEEAASSVRSGSTRHATRGQHFYAKLDGTSDHFDEVVGFGLGRS